MGDHLESKDFAFIQFGYYWQKMRQICQILLISLRFGKTQLCGLFSRGICAQQGHWVKNEEVH